MIEIALSLAERRALLKALKPAARMIDISGPSPSAISIKGLEHRFAVVVSPRDLHEEDGDDDEDEDDEDEDSDEDDDDDALDLR